MQEAKHFICIGHVARPSIPSRVFNAVTEACENKDDYKDGVGWMKCYANVGSQMACWSNERYSALAKIDMQPIVEECRAYVST
jgi:hypothetical protein